MKITLVHLSDIHFSSASDPVANRGTEIARAVVAKGPDADLHIVVISGDIANTGDPAEYAVAKAFLEQLETEMKTQLAKVEFVAVPGNHDCNLRKNTETRDFLLGGLQRLFSTPFDPDGKNCVTLAAIQEDFFDFYRILTDQAISDGDRLYYIREVEVGGARIRLHCFNSSWLSRKNEIPGELYIPPELYSKYSHLAPADMSIVVMHHPYNWLNPTNYRAFRRFVEDNCDLCLSGHEHCQNVSRRSDLGEVSVDYSEGAALHDPKFGTSGFSVFQIDLECQKQAMTVFEWTTDRYHEARSEEWVLARNKRRPLVGFENTEEFRRYLNGVGINFSHPRRSEVQLRDLYIYPDLQCRSLKQMINKGRAVNIKGEGLLRAVTEAKKAAIYGPDDIGKTSLAKILYLDLRAMGLVPVLLMAEDVKGCKSVEALSAAVRQAVRHQYGEQSWERIIQLPRTVKLLIVDDFHLARLRPTHAAESTCDDRGKSGCYAPIHLRIYC